MSKPDRAETDSSQGPKPPARAVDEDVIVVPHRPGGFSPLLLPPFLIVLLGAGFLAYRVQTPDWRGLTWSWNPPKSNSRLLSQPGPEVALKTQPAPAVPAPTEVAETKEEPQPKPESAETKEIDPLDDIQREADKTKERIETLEKLKLEQDKKLAENEGKRRAEEPWFFRGRGMGMNPDQLRRMIEAQRAILEQQMAMMEQFQQRQLERMSPRQRDFFGQGKTGTLPGQMALPFGFPPGNALTPFGEGFMAIPEAGAPQFREFRGPNGQRGFELRWQTRRLNPGMKPDAAGAPPPPTPPRPEPRVFD
jgi:hypothetical protein